MDEGRGVVGVCVGWLAGWVGCDDDAARLTWIEFAEAPALGTER